MRGAENFGDAYFAFYLLAMGSGKPRSFARISEMLADAGFAGIKLLPSADATGDQCHNRRYRSENVLIWLDTVERQFSMTLAGSRSGLAKDAE